jgi:hypothetical protein
MPKGRISRVIAVLLVAGCADATFNLLPPPSKPAPGGEAGEAGMAGDQPASGGSAGLGGMGGSVAGGCNAEDGCFYCRDDRDCETPKPICHGDRCVRCRPKNCPPGTICEGDCGRGERCDWRTFECAPDCYAGNVPCSPDRLRFCDPAWSVCTECDPSRMDSDFGCPGDLKCSPRGSCEKCSGPFDCPQYQPICENWECRGCRTSQDCNVAGFEPRICDNDGRCVQPPESSP